MKWTSPTLAVFDLDNTLYEYQPAHEAGEKALRLLGTKETGLPPARWNEEWTAARAAVKARLGRTAASHSRLLYSAEMLERVGFKHQPKLLLQLEQTYWREFLLASRLRPGIDDLLVALRYNAVSVAIVTDLTLQIQLRKLVHLKVEALIDHLVASEETPNDKWSGVSFRLLLQRVGTDAARCVWFIGDGPDDTPVQRLIEEGLIADGRGFVFGGSRPESHLEGWRDARSISRALANAVGAQE